MFRTKAVPAASPGGCLRKCRDSVPDNLRLRFSMLATTASLIGLRIFGDLRIQYHNHLRYGLGCGGLGLELLIPGAPATTPVSTRSSGWTLPRTRRSYSRGLQRVSGFTHTSITKLSPSFTQKEAWNKYQTQYHESGLLTPLRDDARCFSSSAVAPGVLTRPHS